MPSARPAQPSPFPPQGPVSWSTTGRPGTSTASSAAAASSPSDHGPSSPTRRTTTASRATRASLLRAALAAKRYSLDAALVPDSSRGGSSAQCVPSASGGMPWVTLPSVFCPGASCSPEHRLAPAVCTRSGVSFRGRGRAKGPLTRGPLGWLRGMPSHLFAGLAGCPCPPRSPRAAVVEGAPDCCLLAAPGRAGHATASG